MQGGEQQQCNETLMDWQLFQKQVDVQTTSWNIDGAHSVQLCRIPQISSDIRFAFQMKGTQQTAALEVPLFRMSICSSVLLARHR
jgi:hypothetical protein